jgi:5'-nucleotidase
MKKEPQILLTNDDGIRSPGLWSAAAALSEHGFVHVIAPREQSSGTGRSFPISSDGIIRIEEVTVNGKTWQVHAIGGTPAQAVLHGIVEVLPQRPDLVVSGINYGENLGSGITVSGTVGAALEGGAWKIPSLAVSLETDLAHHHSHSPDVDFSAAAHFTGYFAGMLLARQLPPDVRVLKVDVPKYASKDTPWKVTRLSMQRYFEPVPPQRNSWEEPGRVGYRLAQARDIAPENSDVYALIVEQVVSVTPLSLDLTSRVDLKALEESLRSA